MTLPHNKKTVLVLALVALILLNVAIGLQLMEQDTRAESAPAAGVALLAQNGRSHPPMMPPKEPPEGGGAEARLQITAPTCDFRTLGVTLTVSNTMQQGVMGEGLATLTLSEGIILVAGETAEKQLPTIRPEESASVRWQAEAAPGVSGNVLVLASVTFDMAMEPLKADTAVYIPPCPPTTTPIAEPTITLTPTLPAVPFISPTPTPTATVTTPIFFISQTNGLSLSVWWFVLPCLALIFLLLLLTLLSLLTGGRWFGRGGERQNPPPASDDDSSARETLSHTIRRLRETENRINGLSYELESSIRIRQELEQQLERYESEQERLQERYARLSAALAHLRETSQSSASESEHLRRQLHDTEIKLVQLEAERSSYYREIERLKDNLHAVDVKRIKLKAERGRCEELRVKLSDAELRIRELEWKLQKHRHSGSDNDDSRLELRLTRLQLDLEQLLKEEVRQHTGQDAQALVDLRVELEQLIEQTSLRNEQEWHDSVEQLQQVTEIVTRFQETIQQWQAQSSLTRNDINDFRTVLNNYYEELSTLQRQLRTLQIELKSHDHAVQRRGTLDIDDVTRGGTQLTSTQQSIDVQQAEGRGKFTAKSTDASLRGTGRSALPDTLEPRFEHEIADEVETAYGAGVLLRVAAVNNDKGIVFTNLTCRVHVYDRDSGEALTLVEDEQQVQNIVLRFGDLAYGRTTPQTVVILCSEWREDRIMVTITAEYQRRSVEIS